MIDNGERTRDSPEGRGYTIGMVGGVRIVINS